MDGSFMKDFESDLIKFAIFLLLGGMLLGYAIARWII